MAKIIREDTFSCISHFTYTSFLTMETISYSLHSSLCKISEIVCGGTEKVLGVFRLKKFGTSALKIAYH